MSHFRLDGDEVDFYRSRLAPRRDGMRKEAAGRGLRMTSVSVYHTHCVTYMCFGCLCLLPIVQQKGIRSQREHLVGSAWMDSTWAPGTPERKPLCQVRERVVISRQLVPTSYLSQVWMDLETSERGGEMGEASPPP